MTLNPAFVQSISQKNTPANERGQVLNRTTFTNTSSQMANPGLLPVFFANQNTANTMPIYDIPDQTKPLTLETQQENLDQFINRENATKLVRFRTGSMKAWNVPLGMTEVRAEDLL